MHVVWADYSADYDIDWELRNYKENYYMVEQFVYLPRVEICLQLIDCNDAEMKEKLPPTINNQPTHFDFLK